MKSRTIDRHPPMTVRLKQLAKQKLKFLNSYHFADSVGQTCFMIGLLSIAGWGVCVAIPVLYSEHGNTGIFFRIFGCFLAIQIFVNYYFIRTVDSAYNPFKHGTQPANVGLGENVSVIRHIDANLNDLGITGSGQSKGRKDAINVPLNFGSVMYVATELPTTEGGVPTRTVFPYFSWTPCLKCNRPRPPRCHHCPSCDKCVLKRDHHCFVTGVCIGYHNLRHFAVFLFWASVATIFATLHAVPYLYYEFLPHFSVFDIFLPFTIVKFILGFISFKHTFLNFMLWLLVGYMFWSLTFLVSVYKNIRTGLTSFEQESNIDIYDTRPLNGKLEAVFGKCWWLNFLVPLHVVFKPMDDPVNWPAVRA